MKIAIDFVSTNLGSGTKTYNINFCKELEKTNTDHEFLIFLTKNYFDEIKAYRKNSKIKYKIKSNMFSKILPRLLWMQFIFPFELKIAGIQKLFSPMNFSPLFLKYFNITNVLITKNYRTYTQASSKYNNKKTTHNVMKLFREIYSAGTARLYSILEFLFGLWPEFCSN